MRCPECVKTLVTVKDENGNDVQQPQQSTIEQVGSYSIFAAPIDPDDNSPTPKTFKQFFDENGKHHVHDNSITETQFKCSMGHTFEVCDPTTVCECGFKPDVAALRAMREKRDADNAAAQAAAQAEPGIAPQPNVEPVAPVRGPEASASAPQPSSATQPATATRSS